MVKEQTAEEVEQASVGSDRRAAVATQRLLGDLDDRGQPLYRVDVRLIGGRERRYVPSQPSQAPAGYLSDDMSGNGGLAGPRNTGERNEAVRRQLKREIAQIVLSRTNDANRAESTFFARCTHPDFVAVEVSRCLSSRRK